MNGNYLTDDQYRAIRDAFLVSNEKFRQTAYFDTRGIPTIATGVALLTFDSTNGVWVQNS
jgi:hypothetical protein